MLQEIAQVGVLGTQIDEPLLRADGVATYGHAFEEQVGALGENDPILEGPRLAFVGVANEKTSITLGRSGELPLHPRREARTAHGLATEMS